MSSKTVFLLFFTLIFGVNSKYTHTSYVTSTQLVTSLMPSSCVSVDPTLQPCRSVRYLSFPNFGPWSNIFNKTVQAKSMATETTSLGWGEYFGIYAPTVTVTQLELQTTFVKDPRIVVTYAVKGCRPHKIPDDLDRCELPQTLSIQTIIPTSTVAILHSSVTTSTFHSSSDTDTKPIPSSINGIQDNPLKKDDKKIHPIIESSTENLVNENINTKLPTQPLPL